MIHITVLGWGRWLIKKMQKDHVLPNSVLSKLISFSPQHSLNFWHWVEEDVINPQTPWPPDVQSCEALLNSTLVNPGECWFKKYQFNPKLYAGGVITARKASVNTKRERSFPKCYYKLQRLLNGGKYCRTWITTGFPGVSPKSAPIPEAVSLPRGSPPEMSTPDKQ
jgi:hypothetical protein